MSAQSAIFDPIPDHARHLFFDWNPSVDPRAALRALAVQCDGQSTVLGIGANITQALEVTVAGLRRFPELPDASPSIPATQQALWLWLRGDEPGDLLLRGHAVIPPFLAAIRSRVG